jgi:hypothetical protein
MVPFASVSRRAFVAAAALFAAGPAVDARKRKRRPKPPQAFATVTVTGVVFTEPGQEPAGFVWKLKGELELASGGRFDLPGEVPVPTVSTDAQTRAAIVRQTREGSSLALKNFFGITIPPDRIQVTLV